MYNYKWYTYVFIVAALILEPYIAGWFSISGAYPNILFIILLFFSMGVKNDRVLILCAATGFVYDLLYSAFFGPVTILFFLYGLLFTVLSRRVKKENIPVMSLSGFVTAFLSNIYTLLLALGFKDFFTMPATFLKEAFFNALYTTCIIAFLTLSLFLIYNSYGKRSKRILYGKSSRDS